MASGSCHGGDKDSPVLCEGWCSMLEAPLKESWRAAMLSGAQILEDAAGHVVIRFGLCRRRQGADKQHRGLLLRPILLQLLQNGVYLGLYGDSVLLLQIRPVG